MRRVGRILLTTLIALALSGLAGGVVAQVLAVETGAQEEYLAVFTLMVLVCLLAGLLFLLVQFLAEPRRAANRLAAVLLALLVGVFAVAGFGVLFGQGNLDALPLLLGLMLPGVAIVLVQWQVVRWRAVPAPMPMRFGRNAG